MLTISSHKGNANQNHTKIPPHPVRIAIITITTNIIGKDVGKKEPLSTAGGNASYCNHSEKKFGGFSKI
jgi:hypothetical protein